MLLGVEVGRDPGLRVIQMNVQQRGPLAIRDGDKHPLLVVDAAPAVAANFAHGLELGDRAVALNPRALDIDDSAERCVGDRRDKNVLGRSGGSGDTEGEENQPGDCRQREWRTHLSPPTNVLRRQNTPVSSTFARKSEERSVAACDRYAHYLPRTMKSRPRPARRVRQSACGSAPRSHVGGAS